MPLTFETYMRGISSNSHMSIATRTNPTTLLTISGGQSQLHVKTLSKRAEN